MTRSFEASDPRDKIFAVFGLATLGRTLLPTTEIIRVDYELTPAEVFLETAWAMIKKSKDLNFLAEVEDPHLRNITDIPTWVPDFSSVHRPSIYHQSLTFNADGGLKRSLTSLSNPRLLGTAAYRLGEVVYADSLGVNEPFIECFPRMLIPLFGELLFCRKPAQATSVTFQNPIPVVYYGAPILNNEDRVLSDIAHCLLSPRSILKLKRSAKRLYRLIYWCFDISHYATCPHL